MTLQIIYLVLGVYGWANWLHGGANKSELSISRTTRTEWMAVAVLTPLATWGMTLVLRQYNDSAPFLDALTTVLSLNAQYLLCVKRIENWAFWIAADLIYVPLYASRGLPLTAVLYAVFLAMCAFGARQWLRSWHARQAPDPALETAA